MTERQSECVHYWCLEVANGATSPGVCRLCGAEKTFSNSPPDGGIFDWSRINAAKDNREDGGNYYSTGNHVLNSLPP